MLFCKHFFEICCCVYRKKNVFFKTCFVSQPDRDIMAKERKGMTTLEILEEKLKQLEEKIKETKLQLPAHSIKPPLMIELIALEDERDAVQYEINSIKNKKKK